MRLLLDRGIGLASVSDALVIAVSNGDHECVNLLLEHGARKDKVAVVRAIEQETPTTASRLIRAGFDIHSTKRRTALHYAAEQGQIEVVETLLDYGAYVDAYDSVRQTPLHIAAALGLESCAMLLLASS